VAEDRKDSAEGAPADVPTAGGDGPSQRRRAPPSRAPRHRPVRRAPPPNLAGFFDSPRRNLAGGLIFILLIAAAATAAYMSQGWSLRDAFYMVVLTIYTVGFQEVRPIDSNFLYGVTITLIILGCTGMIFLTGVIVQFFTLIQINRLTGQKKMEQKISEFDGHVIVCGFGRVGRVLARALRRSSASFVVIDESEARIAEARRKLSLPRWRCDERDSAYRRGRQARPRAGLLPLPRRAERPRDLERAGAQSRSDDRLARLEALFRK
jgi:hypothetical protein